MILEIKSRLRLMPWGWQDSQNRPLPKSPKEIFAMKFMPLLAATALLFITHTAEAKMVTKEIDYKDGATPLKGVLYYDDSVHRPLPGVLVVHEWWGLSENIKAKAEKLAALGYVAFAADIYGKDKFANNPEEAEKLATPFYKDPGLMVSRAEAGLAVLKKQPQVDATRLAATGYCFGGSVVLQLARSGADVLGVVSFHGGLKTSEPAEPGRVKAQVLALDGGADKLVSPKERANFKKEMADAGVTFKVVEYPGALHAFTNPKATEIGKRFNMPIAYDADADQKSWDEMRGFLKRIFTAKPVETAPAAAEQPAAPTTAPAQ